MGANTQRRSTPKHSDDDARQRMWDVSDQDRADLDVLYSGRLRNIAYVDEAERTDRDNESAFYVLASLVVPAAKVRATQRVIKQMNDGRRWHTTNVFQSKQGSPERRELERRLWAYIDYLAQDDASKVVLFDDRDRLVRARKELARHVDLRELGEILRAEHEVDLLVIERRRENEWDADEQTLKAIRDKERGIQTKQALPSAEPILWAADILASTYRRKVAVKEPKWFDKLEPFVDFREARRVRE